jgi:spoIIIJ-associated protein
MDKPGPTGHPISMTAIDHAHQILDTMLGYLGFTVQIEDHDSPEGPTLQILTDDADTLIGRRGEILDDIQYLVNRILVRHLKGAPRIRVDVEYYRSIREDTLVDHVQQMAQRVRATGKAVVLNPMNSYYRRIVHNVFLNDPEVASVSENGPSRFKRITLKRRPAS